MTLEDILEKGYFPKELPPAFTTKYFSDHFKSMSNFSGMRGNEKISNYSNFSVPKLNYFRTKVALVNPYNFLILAETIVANWSDIERNIYNGSTITTSLPKINDSHFNTEKTFSEYIESSLQDSLNKDTILISDISRFYSSIYTHSIPWAIHTKEVAKQDRTSNLYGNKIDTAVRNCQDQQTNGIPIGPITSLIIAEILLCSIDKKLLNDGVIFGKRYIDDYMLFLENTSKAEDFFKKLQSLLLDYQLEINSGKTRIEKIPYDLEEEWISDISTFISASYRLEQKNFLTKLYSKVLNLVKKYPTKYVIKYVIRIVEDIFIEQNNWDLFQTILLNLTKLEPSILPTTLSIILSYHDKYNFSLTKIRTFYYSLIEEHLVKGNHFEVTWSLWSLFELDQTVDNSLANKVMESQDWCSKLIILFLESENLISGELTYKNIEKANITPADLYNEKWLYIYESYKKNWLDVNTGSHPIQQDTFFKRMLDNGIKFFDETKKVKRIDVDSLELNNLMTFEFDESRILEPLESMKEKIATADDFEQVKDAYKDLINVFEEFVESTNTEFAEHIQKLLASKRDY